VVGMNKKAFVALLVAFALVFALTSEWSVSVDSSTYHVGDVVNITVVMPMKVYAIKFVITLPSNETEETPALGCMADKCVYQYIPELPGHYIITLLNKNISVEFDVLQNEAANETVEAKPFRIYSPTLSQFPYYDEKNNLTFFYYLIPSEDGYGTLIIENLTPHLQAIVLYNFSINSSLHFSAYEINESIPQPSNESATEETENQTAFAENNETVNESEVVNETIQEFENQTTFDENNESINETANETVQEPENQTSFELMNESTNKTEESNITEQEIDMFHYITFINLSDTNFSYAEFYFLLEYNTLFSCMNFTNDTCFAWDVANYTQMEGFAVVNTTENFLVFAQKNISQPVQNVSENITEPQNVSEKNITIPEDEFYKQLEVVFSDMGFNYYEDFGIEDITEEVHNLFLQRAFFVVYDKYGEGRIPEYILSMIDEKHANLAVLSPSQPISRIVFHALFLDENLSITAYKINDTSFVMDSYYLFYPEADVFAEKNGEYLYGCKEFDFNYSCKTGLEQINYTYEDGYAKFTITKEYKLFLWSDEPISAYGEEQNATELLPSLNLNILDSHGKKRNFTYEILNYTGRNADATFYFDEGRVHSITFYGLSLAGNSSIILDDINNELFLVDLSGSNFSDAVVVAKDYGGELYKCREFDNSYSCLSGWVKWPYFSSSGFIVFKLLPEDPLFIQRINASANTTINVLDPFGNPVNGSYEILDNSSGLDIRINFNSGQVLQLTIYDVEDDGFEHTIVVGDTYTNDTSPYFGNITPSNAPPSILNNFIINLSNLSYNYSLAVVRNSGSGIYKCREFSSNFSCIDYWEPYQYYSNGINYSFNLTESDPMFGYGGGGGNASPMDITTCRAITTPGYHSLDNNLLGDNPTQINGYYYCIAIQVSNVELDCRGFEIRGNRALGYSVGIIIYDTTGLPPSPLTNVTVRNCSVLNYTRNLWIDSNTTTDHSQIVVRDSRFNLSSGNSIRVEDCDNSNFTNLVVDRTSDGGILFLTDSTNNRVNNFTGLNSANFFILDQSGSNTFTNITLRNGGWAGIWISGVDNSVVDGFDIRNITESGGTVYGGIYVSSGGDYNTIRNGKIYDLVTYGIQVEGTYNNITNVTIYNSTSESGIFIDGDAADNNRIYNSTIYKNADHGIYVNNGDNLLISGVRVENHTSGYEVYLYGSSVAPVSNVLIENSRFVNNKTQNTMGIHSYYGQNITVNNCSFTEIYIGNYFNQSTAISVKNSTFLRNGKAGVFFDSTNASSILNNNINDTYASSATYLDPTRTCNISDTSTESGIILCSSTQNAIEYNYIKGNGTSNCEVGTYSEGQFDGIYLYSSNSTNISYNTVKAADSVNIQVQYSRDILIKENDLSGKYSIKDSADNIKLDYTNYSQVLSNNLTQSCVYSFNSERSYYVNVSSNRIYSNAGTGMNLGLTSSIINNNIVYSNSKYGMYSAASVSGLNNIFNNTVYDNGQDGFYSFNVFGNNITNNSFYNNSWYQLRLNFSASGFDIGNVYNNIFNASTGQWVVYDNSGGMYNWNTSYSCSTPNIIGGQCIGGNFYSNYTGVDDGSGASYPHNIGGDGIGDNPPNYSIYGGTNWDYLPLTNNASVCFYASTSNTLYTLTGNLYGNKSDRICITINASNITIDCAGYNITGRMGYGNLTIGIGNYDARSNVTIKNCYITNYTFGIYANLSNKYNITNNSIIRNGKAGIFLDSTENSTIWDNDINDTFWTAEDPGGDYLEFCNWSAANFYKFEGGIVLCSSNYTTISYNYLKGNGTCSGSGCLSNHNGSEAGIFTYNSRLNNITYNIFRNSGDNYDSLYFYSYDTNYWYNDQNGTDPSTGNWNVNDGIKLDHSKRFNISHSNFSNNYEWGIFFTWTNDSYIYNNTASYNRIVGIRLARSANNKAISNTAFQNAEGFRIQFAEAINNTLTNNSAYNNSYYGFYLYYSSNNTLTNNTVYNNSQYQIYLQSSNYNLIYNNIFNASTGQGVVYDSGSNYWNTSYDCSGTNIIGGDCIGGNFYSDYSGTDSNGDGIGETIYSILGGSNIDFLPLTNQRERLVEVPSPVIQMPNKKEKVSQQPINQSVHRAVSGLPKSITPESAN